MKIVSWNVNGLRASLRKGFQEKFDEINAEIFCLQETKMMRGQAEIELDGYFEYWNSAERKGYSGTAIFTKHEPLNVINGTGIRDHDKEGRVITLEFENYFLVNCYTPNSGRELVRLDYRMTWEDAFRQYLIELDAKKPVILCGDLNVAHEEIDIKNHKTNHKNAGFTDDERAKMTELLKCGFVDSFRKLYPDRQGAYTWWSMMPGIRERNVGWRIDYFVTSERVMTQVDDVKILSEVYGSDHCPVMLEIK